MILSHRDAKSILLTLESLAQVVHDGNLWSNYAHVNLEKRYDLARKILKRQHPLKSVPISHKDDGPLPNLTNAEVEKRLTELLRLSQLALS